MTKVVRFPIAASQGHACRVAAVLRQAHILSLASSTPPASPEAPVTKSAVVVPFARGFVAAPSLTGRTATATPNDGGGDAA